MYLSLGGSVAVPKKDVIGVFDLDTAPADSQMMEFLKQCEKKKMVTVVGVGIPKAFVLTSSGDGIKVYITTISASSIKGRNQQYF